MISEFNYMVIVPKRMHNTSILAISIKNEMDNTIG